MKALQIAALGQLALQLILSSDSTAIAQTALSPEQLDNAIKICAAGQKIELTSETVSKLSRLYSDQSSSDPTAPKASTKTTNLPEFLKSVPEDSRLEAYRLYVDCITKIVEAAAPPPPRVTVTYRVCSGEYQRACQPHDAYLYCYADVAAWAEAKCTSSTIQRLSTYGGNKCGYAIDAIICSGPK